MKCVINNKTKGDKNGRYSETKRLVETRGHGDPGRRILQR
jgi:hypothetical protein